MPPKAPLNPRNFPRPPLLERTPRHLQIKWDGQLIADTKEAYWVLETTHPPSKLSLSDPQTAVSASVEAAMRAICLTKSRCSSSTSSLRIDLSVALKPLIVPDVYHP